MIRKVCSIFRTNSDNISFLLLVFFSCLKQIGRICDTCCLFAFYSPFTFFTICILIQLLFLLYHKINRICMTIRMGKIYIHLVIIHLTLAREFTLYGTKAEMLNQRNDASNPPKRLFQGQ